MNGTFQIYKAETAPKFFLCYTTSDTLSYSYLTLGSQVQTGQEHLEVFDTEEQLAAAIDTVKGVQGWYMQDENRIPSPPNPNVWTPAEPTPDEPTFEGA